MRQQKTATMYQGIFQEASPTYYPSHLSSESGKKYRIIHSQMDDFLCEEAFVSLGENPFDREGIILDPSSKTLALFYNTFSKKFPITIESDFLILLEQLSDYIHAHFYKNSKNYFSTIENLIQDSIKYNKADFYYSENKSKKGTLISLDIFILNNIGICRHQSLLACYCIARIISDLGLQNYEVRHVRGHIKGGAGHSWVMVSVGNGLWVHFDSLWKKVLRVNEVNVEVLNRAYTEEAIASIRKKLIIQRDFPDPQTVPKEDLVATQPLL